MELRERGGRARWVADIRVRLPSGALTRERRDVPGNPSSKRAAMRWATARERELIRHGVEDRRPAAPTIAAFQDDFLRHAASKGRKPSTLENHRCNLKHHIVPLLGRVRLNAVEPAHVARIWGIDVQSATKNKIAATLSAVLNSAIELGHLDARDKPRIRFLKQPRTTAPFFTRAQFEDLVAAARQLGPEHLCITLLGGEAGLRAGEIRALHWRSVLADTQALIIEHSEWHGHVGTPKSNRFRRVAVPARVIEALAQLERAAPTVLARDDGSMITASWLRHRLHKALDRAGLPRSGPHALRHTFCSLLAKEGASAAAIRNLAGHSNVSITDRYMHLAPGEDAAAVRLLERAARQEQARREGDERDASRDEQGEPPRERRGPRLVSGR
ncbi:MAG: site-specific integrase [Myxococcales bacterium]|nr:site-specific integrase [Myxococcales bacterium]